ncbi:MAG: hypothetical protein ACKO3T_17205 [Planctomycetaceae bacterium]
MRITTVNAHGSPAILSLCVICRRLAGLNCLVRWMFTESCSAAVAENDGGDGRKGRRRRHDQR